MTALFRFVGALALGLMVTFAGQAQTPFAPAIVVNDDVVTFYDLEQRRALYRAFGMPPAILEDQVVADLTDEALMRQESRRIGILVGERELQAGYNAFAQQRGLSGDQLTAQLTRAGIDPGTLRDQIEAQLGWRDAMQARFTSRARPNERDIEEAMMIDATGISREVLLAEIAIPYAERGEARTNELITQIYEDVRNGGDFRAAAREFSRAQTARNGGEIGWVATGDLPGPMRAEIDLIDAGGVTRPIPITRGVSLLAVLDERRVPTRNSGLVTISYVRATFPIDGGEAAARTAATEARRRLDGCADMTARADEFGPGSGRFGPEPLSSVNPALFSVLATAQLGQISQPVRIGDSISLIALCSRDVSLDADQRQQVQNQIFADRVSAFADGYLQELRRDAVIDVR
ncbi:peptidylprolyl isomerase [Pontivivens ytuae]|uniref:Parvulin-like PPIase n=1 Tax=Pontivivens ytuae TaxID=2789856 RepID=A0A7S9LRH3_9RHOB|nr:peptidylprolyl isomerase [Pontivivens ytuae]QPH53908.1 peptidylprolyl isomerase [Pontivivens ytuae]